MNKRRSVLAGQVLFWEKSGA